MPVNSTPSAITGLPFLLPSLFLFATNDAQAGEAITFESRRGKLAIYARADAGIAPGSVFIPFCDYEAAANKLTNAARAPFAKIAEVKFCAVRISKGGEVPSLQGYPGLKA